MTDIGDPGHVTGHNDLEAGIRAQATRFGTTVTLTGPFSIGAPNHIGIHNLEVAAIQQIADIGGVTVTLPDTANLGDLGHTSDHDLMTAAVAALAAAPAWNAATGGATVDVPNWNGTGQTWRVHTFTGNGTFTVTRGIQPFRIVPAGAGGGGGGEGDYFARGGNGGAGTAVDVNVDLAAGTYPVTVGQGGPGGGRNANGGPGGASFVAAVLAGGGGGGINGTYGGATGSPNGPTLPSNVSGATVTYGAPGGGGWGDPDFVAKPGGNGTVVIAYQIGA